MSNGLIKRKKPEKVVDIKAEYERIQRQEEEDRLATEKQINDIMEKGGYQYFLSAHVAGVEVALNSLINPSLPLTIRLVPKPKE